MDYARLAAHAAAMMRKRFPHLSPERSLLSAKVIVESGIALMDRATLDFDTSPGLIHEVIILLTSYFDVLAIAE